MRFLRAEKWIVGVSKHTLTFLATQIFRFIKSSFQHKHKKQPEKENRTNEEFQVAAMRVQKGKIYENYQTEKNHFIRTTNDEICVAAFKSDLQTFT